MMRHLYELFVEKKYENELAEMELLYENQERVLKNEYANKKQKQLQIKKSEDDQK